MCVLILKSFNELQKFKIQRVTLLQYSTLVGNQSIFVFFYIPRNYPIEFIIIYIILYFVLHIVTQVWIENG